jgi:ribosomal protein L37AE/L43A
MNELNIEIKKFHDRVYDHNKNRCAYCSGIGSIVKRPKKKFFICASCGRREWI